MGDHTSLCINVRKLLRTFLRTRVKQIAVAVHVYVDKLSKLVVVIVIGRSIAHSTLHTPHSTLDTRHSTLDTPHPAFRIRHSTLDTKRRN